MMKIRSVYRKFTLNFLKLLSLSIGAILNVSCNTDGVMYGPAPEYGMPHADYKFSGTVKSADSNEPVKNILVRLSDSEGFLIGDSTLTDSAGGFEIKQVNEPVCKQWKISLEDIDSVVNGKFMNKDTLIEISDNQFSGSTGYYYRGNADIRTDIKIERDE